MRRQDNIAWNNSWIAENVGKYHMISDFHKAYAEEVDATVSQRAFRTHVRRKFSLSSDATWTEEEREWVRVNFHRLGGLKCVPLFEDEFGKKRTHRAIEAEARRQGLLVDADVVESNKNYSRRVPLGTITDDGEGYLKIKTGKGSSGWERYHRYLYEQRNGEVPKGYKIIFLDGDRRNYAEGNMIAVPSAFLALMNKLKLKSSDADITMISVRWCELYTLLKEQGYVEETED